MWRNKKVMLMVKFPELAMTCGGGGEVEILRLKMTICGYDAILTERNKAKKKPHSWQSRKWGSI
jgi:hypothetical protein